MPRRCRRSKAALRRAGGVAQSGFRPLWLGGAGPNYDQNGMNCRQYTHTIYIDGKPQTARGAACRNPDGTWQPV